MSTKEKNLELERLVFFSDAIVAIAITILVFGVKLDIPAGNALTYHDLLRAWPSFLAFFLSFFIIALFWMIHHRFFCHIRDINEVLLWNNIAWLLFVALLPFSTTLIAMHFQNKPAMVVYCGNVFMITIFQNNIWDYASKNGRFLKTDVDERIILFYRRSCNVAMINSVISLVLAFFFPLAAFINLVARIPSVVLARRIFKLMKLREVKERKLSNQR
ncbi:putative membrane protein [Mucilaginibacter yixingensis]|uniref:Putative membrane protein n=1 Tax=Mucilaginibacter yixingensis TaxID=1295612 RepID=A0A2T5J5W8_9SPHI|nr:TMEM175 family protein [Mucilaginibacter yixingensis]PTQ93610.1 putative membrane protein [Mucilaginibacter yixingensis]